jgi:hypothetical protein
LFCFSSSDDKVNCIDSSRAYSMDFHQEYIPHEYLELKMPAGTDTDGHATFLLDPNYLHIWPRHSFMLIALPNKVRGPVLRDVISPFDGTSFPRINLLHVPSLHPPQNSSAYVPAKLLWLGSRFNFPMHCLSSVGTGSWTTSLRTLEAL